MPRRKLKEFNKNNLQHLEILRFIVRWKYVNIDMILSRFKTSKTHIQELLTLMSPSKTIMSENGKTKKIWYGLLRKINNKSHSKKGRKTNYFTPTYKGIKEAGLPYTPEVSIRENILIGPHTQNCINVINQLGLDEDQYFTEQELWIRFKAFKEKYGLKTRPRFCDFAYIKDGKFIGVEVENYIKNYKEYVSEKFDPRFGPQAYSTLKKDKHKWGYFKDGEAWTPIILKTNATTIIAAKKDALAAGVPPGIVNDKNKFGKINKYRITFQNKSHFALQGISIKQLKDLISKDPDYGKWKIVKGELIKGSDCIFYRLMYGINQRFYNEIHWYFPEGLDKLFNNFIEKTFEGGYNHSFFKVFSFKENKPNLKEIKLESLTTKI